MPAYPGVEDLSEYLFLTVAVDLVSPGRSTEVFQKHLLFIHRFIRTHENVADLGVLARDELGHAAGHDSLIGGDMVEGEVVKLLHQLPAMFVVPPGEKYRELVAAHPVHRAVDKNVAHHTAGFADKLVARLVA